MMPLANKIGVYNTIVETKDKPSIRSHSLYGSYTTIFRLLVMAIQGLGETFD